VIVAALWWLYFAVPAGSGLEDRRQWSFVWGYGHYVPFAALAALGAGLEVAVAGSVGHADELGARGAVAAVAVPVAVVIVMLEMLRVPAGSTLFRPATVAALLALGAVVAGSEQVGLAAGVCLVAVTVAAAVAADVTLPTS
jgi:low temperature requirement protein LtrA